jgi:hypothetical protein
MKATTTDAASRTPGTSTRGGLRVWDPCVTLASPVVTSMACSAADRPLQVATTAGSVEACTRTSAEIRLKSVDRDYEGHRRRAGSHHTKSSRRARIGLCRSSGPSGQSVASRKPRNRDTLGRLANCTREDLPPAL